MAEEKPAKKSAPRKKKAVQPLPMNPADLARQLRDAARTSDLNAQTRKMLMDTANAVADADAGDPMVKQVHEYVTGGSMAEDLKVNVKAAEKPAAKPAPKGKAKATSEAPAEKPVTPVPEEKPATMKVKVPKASKPAAPKNATAGAEAAATKPLTVGRLASRKPTEATAPETTSETRAAAEEVKPAPVEAPVAEVPPAAAAAPKADAPPAAKSTATAGAKAAEAEKAKGILSRLAGMRKSKMGMLGLAGLAALAGGSIYRATQMPQDRSKAEEALAEAEARSRSAKIAKLLEQARMERTLAENQRRLAQSNPDLYTSVMAGRRVPAGSVVLGGRPRMDLMQELAASMDSGRYARPDPLSELMG